MHPVKILTACSLFISVAASSYGASRTGFTDNAVETSKSAAEVSSAAMQEEVVEGIEEEYEAITTISATAEYYTPSQPESDHRGLSKYDCLIGDCR